MTVIETTRDAEALTLTVVAEFASPPARVWQVWADPRKLERWWGPPTWPATFVEHEFTVGGRAHYFMTGPDGERSHGWWRFTAIDEPRVLEFEDGFADDAGNPDPALGTTHAHVTFAEMGEGTRMVVHSRFASAEQMEQMVAMGMEEGLRGAMGQIDAILTEG
jgi:uncharacterized protein YndB with AHSA1/START domain